nr:sigma-54-dependent Fis family transcriptional regulator [Planctomycetota bacterium]
QGKIERQALDDGATFRIGRTYFRFEEEEEPAMGQTVVGDDGSFRDPDKIQGLIGTDTQLFRRRSSEQELKQANEYLRMLHQVVQRANDADTREALFEVLDDVAADLLEGDRCAVFLPTPDSWRLWPTHERRLRARFGATPYASGLLAAARARLEPLLCTLEGDLDPTTSMVQAGVRSAMVAPLRIGEDVHALLYVDRLENDDAFTRQDLEWLAAVANQLAVRLANQATVAELTAELDRLSQEEVPHRSVDLIGHDASMDVVHSFIAKAAPTPAPVLVTGESGTGKELVARALHLASKRADKPLQIVNCAAMAESLVEATLFGHVKGAYTGADNDRPGLFELADQGTLFLDEVGELPQSVQAKLLRVLEQGEVQRLGENLTRTVDVRLIAATNRKLEDEVTAGNFREDLFHRLNVLQIELPALRERPGDIDALIDHFLVQSAKKLEAPTKKLDPKARTVLMAYAWPGNVRQLRNTVERAAIMASSETIRVEDLPDGILDAEPSDTFHTPIVSLSEVERLHILRVLDHCGGNKKATAEMLGIDRSTLYAKLRQYGAH